jgi:hypothetical protein
VNCDDSDRCMLSSDKARRTVQEIGTKRNACTVDPDDGDMLIKRFASYDIGAVGIGKERIWI